MLSSSSNRNSRSVRLVGHFLLGIGLLWVVRAAGNPPVFAFLPWTYFLLLSDSLFREPGSPEIAENFKIAATVVLVCALAFPLGWAIEAWLCPRTIDTLLRRVDLAMALDGFALTRFCRRFPILWATLSVVYGSLAYVMALSWLIARRSSYWRASAIRAAFAGALYLLFSAVGPRFVYAGWPAASSTFSPDRSGVMRNCMPSMHFAWAILAAWNVPGKWRIPFGAFAVLTAIAAVANGQHYSIDMLAALPFAVFVRWISGEPPGRAGRLTKA